MNRILKIKILKVNRKLFYIVVALNKKSIKSHYIKKLGVCFFFNKKKVILLSLKNLSYWLNKGAKINNYVSYIFSIIFNYYFKNNKINKQQYQILKNIQKNSIKYKK
jgi:ribosomal protein S16